MRTEEIRQRYLDFFSHKGHAVVKSDSLIPAGDPTLLFTGAGMNQFKEYFLGIKKDMTRAVSSQKCLRTGDLDNVGVTNYHHSFFEMLGNFSFADYFKKEAIEWAWEFLTKELNIPQGRLRVSVHHADDEAFEIWHKHIGLDAAIIFKLGDKDNFWPSNAPQEGPNGPCGPCSEIFFDQGESVGCGRPECGVECDCGRFAEIWNLVFTQFDRVGVNELIPLAGKNIDTGMGLERLACVMQGKRSNFEIDIFEDLLAYLGRITKKSVGDNAAVRKAMYAIADHIRAVTFSIADGAYPSNEGRGYVIRKLIRRSVWQGRTLGLQKAFLAPMVELLGKSMGEAYPEIVTMRSEIEQIVTAEEERFLTALEDGLVKLHQIIEEVKKRNSATIRGEDVFKLHDTFGFPDELTESIAVEHGLSINREVFESLLEEQKIRAREASNISGAIFAVSDLDKKIAEYPATEFRGYAEERVHECSVLALIVDGDFVDDTANLHENALVKVILNKTPFYAESGGQIGDKGEIRNESFSMSVVKTRKSDTVFIHEGFLKKGKLKVGDTVEAIVDSSRKAIMCNHTSTHLLHAALREVLGKHVRQFGSEVRADKFRFDFSFQRALTDDEIQQVEDLVNAKIREGLIVNKIEKSIKEATEEGAIALFGEKYGDTVRVVTVGDFSKELCGGTHVDNTKEIEFFKITKESSISSGTRRIEAMTADQAKAFMEEQKIKSAERAARKSAKENKKKQKSQRFDEILQEGVLDSLLVNAISSEIFEGAKLFPKVFDDLDKNALLKISDHLKQKLKDEKLYMFVLVGKDQENGKLSAVVTVSDALASQGINAGSVANALAQELNGRGGGKANIAFAGGSNMAFDDTSLLTFIQKCQIAQ